MRWRRICRPDTRESNKLGNATDFESGSGVASIAVVYLARMAEGIEPLQKFAASYAAFPPGVTHDLVVVFKGFRTEEQLRRARQVFASIRHQAIEIDDSGFDINAYYRAAQRISHNYVCFLNTFSEIVAADWLSILYKYAALPDVGIAGVSGSYESLPDSIALTHKIDWLCNAKQVPYDPRLDYFYGHVINIYCKAWKTLYKGQPLPSPVRQILQAWYTFLRVKNHNLSDVVRTLMIRTKYLFLKIKNHVLHWSGQLPAESKSLTADEQFSLLWSRLTSTNGHLNKFSGFSEFPNPHLRSNAFMLPRLRFLELKGAEALTKQQAYDFESGTESATAQVVKLGLRAVVVNRYGEAYDVVEWSRSRTFRLGKQEGLMVHDNQSRVFESMAPGSQVTYRRMTWGDYLEKNPSERPDLGFKFAVSPSFPVRSVR